MGLPLTKLGFLAVQLWPIFLLKYSLRRAMLQLEFRWSKPDEKHPKQSKTETSKTAFRSSKTLKSYAGDGPATAGCLVSNPDNNCANGLFSIQCVQFPSRSFPVRFFFLFFISDVHHQFYRKISKVSDYSLECNCPLPMVCCRCVFHCNSYCQE